MLGCLQTAQPKLVFFSFLFKPNVYLSLSNLLPKFMFQLFPWDQIMLKFVDFVIVNFSP